MKSKKIPHLTWIASFTLACSFSAQAVDVIKANNVDTLNQSTSWLAPLTSSDIAVWDSTVTSENTTGSLGGDLTVAGIKIINPGGAVMINAGNTLTLGTSGIDMSIATQDLTLNNAVSLLTTGSQIWNVAANRSITVNGAIGAGGSTRSLIKYGVGTLTLAGANTTASRIQLEQGTLNLDYTTAGSRLSDTSALLLRGGTLNLSGGSAAEVVGSTTLSAGTTDVGSATKVTRSSGSSTLQMNVITRNKGATINFEAAGIANADVTAITNGIIGSWATVGGADWATASVGSDQGITAYSGYKNFSDGSFVDTDNVTMNQAAPALSANINSLRFNENAERTLTLSGTIKLTSGGLLITSNVGTNATTITGGNLIAADNQDLVIHQNNPNADLTIDSVIAAYTGSGLTKSGAGRLILTKTNLYTGPTWVNEGVLNIRNSQGTGTTGGRVMVASGAALEMQDGIAVGAEALHIAGNGIGNGGALRNISGNNIWGGTVQLQYDARINCDSGKLTLNNTSGTGAIVAATNNAAALTVGGAGDIDINAIIGSATNNIRALIKDGSGTLSLSGANLYSGPTNIQAGTIRFDKAVALNAANWTDAKLIVEAGASAAFRVGGTGFTAANIDTLKALGTATGGFKNGSNIGIDTTNGNFIYGSSIGNTNGGGNSIGLTKLGAGTLELTAANTYTGKTTVTQGTLKLSGSGSIGASSSIEIKPGAFLDVSGVIGGYEIASTQTLNGTGGVTGAILVSGTLSPGNSPGTMTTGSETWLDGGDYNWQVLNAAGTAGTGYDTIAITGTLDLTNLSADGFNLNLWSLSSILPDVNGDAINFNNLSDYAWTILTTTGGITGFDAADFAIHAGAFNGTNGFTNDLGGGSFALNQSGNSLVLNFTAAPEPGSALLGGLGLLALLRRRR